MPAHSKTVTTKKGNKRMTTYYIRGSTIWLNYYVEGARKQKSTKLKNTPLNIEIVKNKIIPALDIKIATGEIYKKVSKTFRHYGSIFLTQKSNDKNALQVKGFYKRIESHFGDRDIDEITRLDIKKFLMSLQIKTKAPYKTVLSNVFELAVDDNVISSNPVANIRLEKQPKKQVEYFSKEEVKTILDVVPDGPLRVYLLIAFNTGMRSGEILGLQLGDFEKDHISIKRTRTLGVIGSGKTYKAQRKVPYPSFILNEVKKIQTDNIFIFGKIDDASKLNYQWYKYLGIAQVKRIRLYCTRHTFATTMLQDNIVSINELAGLLGHSSARTTLEKYAGIISPEKIDLGNNFSLYGDNTVTVKNNKSRKALKQGI